MRINQVLIRLLTLMDRNPRYCSPKLPFVVRINGCQYCAFCCKGCPFLSFSRKEGKFYCKTYNLVSKETSYCRHYVCYPLRIFGVFRYDVRTEVFYEWELRLNHQVLIKKNIPLSKYLRLLHDNIYSD